MKCNEIFLSDIVGVEFFLASSVVLPVPINTPGIVELANPFTEFSSPYMYLSLSPKNDSIPELSMEPTVKVSTSTKNYGRVFTHEASLSVDHGIDVVNRKISSLRARDVHILYTCANGDKFLSLSCPNTSSISIETSGNPEQAMSVKVKIMSMSGIIRLK